MKQKLTRKVASARKSKRTAKVAPRVRVATAERKPRTIANGSNWVDELYGSASFTDQDLAKDERLRDLVMGARTKPTHKSADRA